MWRDTLYFPDPRSAHIVVAICLLRSRLRRYIFRGMRDAWFQFQDKWFVDCTTNFEPMPSAQQNGPKKLCDGRCQHEVSLAVDADHAVVVHLIVRNNVKMMCWSFLLQTLFQFLKYLEQRMANWECSSQTIIHHMHLGTSYRVGLNWNSSLGAAIRLVEY